MKKPQGIPDRLPSTRKFLSELRSWMRPGLGDHWVLETCGVQFLALSLQPMSFGNHGSVVSTPLPMACAGQVLTLLPSPSPLESWGPRLMRFGHAMQTTRSPKTCRAARYESIMRIMQSLADSAHPLLGVLHT